MGGKLAHKIALVTGGSRGIGAAIVHRLAGEGAAVAFTFSSSSKQAQLLESELKARGMKAKAYQADASKPELAAKLIQNVVSDFGKLDILVNNAGVFGMGKIGEVAMEEYERIMNVNVKGVFALANEAAKVMKPGSRIINISSGAGERASFPGMSTYAASKFAVNGLSRGWAQDLGAKGILVNAVLPGPINTDMNPENSAQADSMKRATALGRYGQPDEVAGAVAFLAGPDATYITGAMLAVDGGWNA